MQRKLEKILTYNPRKEYFVITMDTVFMGKIGRWAKKHHNNVRYISSVRSTHAEITGKYYPVLKNYFLSDSISVPQSLRKMSLRLVFYLEHREHIDNFSITNFFIKLVTAFRK